MSNVTKILKLLCLGVILALVLSVVTMALPTSAKSGANGFDFSGTPTEGSAPLTVEFTCSDWEAYEYCWDFGDDSTGTSTQPSISHTYECAGVYDVTCTPYYYSDSSIGSGIALADNGYSVTKEEYITVYPIACFTASPTMGIAPLTVQFKDCSTGLCSGSWEWSFGDGESSSQSSPSHTYFQGGTYTVTLTVSGSPSDTVSKLNLIIVEEGVTPPNLVVRDLNINPVYAEPRQEIQVTAKVANEGGAWGSAEMQLLINGQFEQAVPVGVAPGTAELISFTVYKTEAREYQVTIGNAMATFYVMEEAKEAPSGYGPLDSGGIIAIVVIAIILVGGVVVVFLLARRPS